MKPIVPLQSSLLARIIFLFGVLVTIPLAVTGASLSLIGRDSVLSSGAELSRVGEDTFSESTAQLTRLATKRVEQTSQQLIDIGQSQLAQMGKDQMRLSGEVLADSSRRLSTTGTETLRSATERMARSTDTVLARSSAELRRMEADAVREASATLIREARRAFAETEQQLARANQQSMDHLATELNLERARRTAEQTRNLLSRTQEIVRQVTAGRVPPRSAGEEAPRSLLTRTVQVWNVRLRQRLPVPILWARLLVPPEQWLPEPEAGDGALEPTRSDAPPTAPLPTAEALAVARSGRPRISALDFEPNDPAPRATLFMPVLLSPESTGVFVVRLSLDFLERQVADRVVMGEGGAPSLVASLSDGRVIAHTDSRRVGTPVTAEEQTVLAAARLQPEGTMLCNLPELGPSLCAFVTIALAGIDAGAASDPRPTPPTTGTPGGAGRSSPVAGRPRAPSGAAEEPLWVVVALQPHRAVLARTAAMQAAIRQAARRAADAMEKEARRRAAALVAATAPKQQRIAAAAGAAIRAENRARVSTAVQSLVRQQQQIATLAAGQAQSRSRALSKEARRRMDERAHVAAQQAGWALKHQTRRSRQAGLQRMQQLTSLTANEAATRMVKSSLWLIAVFLSLAFFFAMATARSLVRPIAAMAAGTAAIARGDFTRRVPVQSRDELGALAKAFNHMADAVQRGRAELEASNLRLAWEKSRIQAIVQSSPDGLVILDDTDQATVLNPSAERLLHLPGDLPDQFPLARLQQYLGHTNGGGVLAPDGEARDLVLDAPHRVLQVRCVPIEAALGSERWALGDGATSAHVSRRAGAPPQSQDHRYAAVPPRAQSRLLHLHDVTREREIDEMKSNFVALVSHELRTPLTSILGFSSYMLTGKLGPITDAQRTGLESIHRQANRLKAIIADFLDVARIEAGGAEFRREPVVIADVVGRVIEDLRPQASEKRIGVQFTAHCSPDESIAVADDARVAQVLTNLLGNALKFTEPGGEVKVVLERRGDRVVTTVHDTGMGIPEEELPRIFDRFYQVEKVATRKAGGTGLGLSIVKSIVEGLGGTVAVASRIGEGTSFSVALPAVEN
jgi:signal transduction histidine kinase